MVNLKTWMASLLDARGTVKMAADASRRRVPEDAFCVPAPSEYGLLLRQNYNVSQLKRICSQAKLRVSGNKEQLRSRVYHFLLLSSHAAKIQKCARLYLREVFKRRGPWSTLRRSWVNDTDFFDLEKVTRDDVLRLWPVREGEHTFVFTLTTFHELAKRPNPKNPYTNNVIDPEVLSRFGDHRRRAAAVGLWKTPHSTATSHGQRRVLALEERARRCFARMDELGHHTQPEWLVDLDADSTCRFLAELADIWGFRAGLTDGRRLALWNDPFGFWYHSGRIVLPRHYRNSKRLCQSVAVGIIERMLGHVNETTGTELGALYILMALTLVSPGARAALPILHQAAEYGPGAHS